MQASVLVLLLSSSDPGKQWGFGDRNGQFVGIDKFLVVGFIGVRRAWSSGPATVSHVSGVAARVGTGSSPKAKQHFSVK